MATVTFKLIGGPGRYHRFEGELPDNLAAEERITTTWFHNPTDSMFTECHTYSSSTMGLMRRTGEVSISPICLHHRPEQTILKSKREHDPQPSDILEP